MLVKLSCSLAFLLVSLSRNRRSDAALPLAGDRATSESARAEQERVRSPLTLDLVESIKSLFMNQ